MIFVLMFLVMTMFSYSWQQDIRTYRPRPYPRLPHFSSGHPADDVVCLPRRDWADIYTSCKNDAAGLLKLMSANKPNEKMVDYSIEGRSKNNYKSKANNDGKDTSPMMDRSFGLKFLGLNALANYFINSVSYTTTSTSYSTTYSTLTIGKVTTCYTSANFRFTTPCRRKRDSSYIKEKLKNFTPSKVEQVEPSFSGVDIMLLGEGNSLFDNIQQILLESSKHEASLAEEKEDSIVAPRKFGYGEEFLENLPGETVYVSSSIITSFAFYTRIYTRTFTTLVAGNNNANRLSCLPDCFILC